MKKTLMGLAAMALLFASCGKNETTGLTKQRVNPDAISLAPSMGKTTRAEDAASLDLLKADTEGIKVLATTADAPTAAFLGEYYKWNAVVAPAAWEWTTPAKFWPMTPEKYPMIFAATYPEDIAVDKFTAADNILAYTATGATDLLWAYSSVAGRPTNGEAAFSFKHALSKISVMMTVGKGKTVAIQSIRFVNLENQNDFHPLNLTTPWTALTTVTNATAFEHYKGLGSPAAAEITGADPEAGEAITGGVDLTLLPQAVAGIDLEALKTAGETTGTAAEIRAAMKAVLDAGAYIEVTYRMHDGTYNLVGQTTGKKNKVEDVDGAAENKYVTVGYALDLDAPVGTVETKEGWLMSKQYTYTIKLGTNDASNGTVLDPEHKADDGTIKPGDPTFPEVDPGTPVTPTNMPIKLGVKVDDWGAAAAEIK